MRRRCWLCAFLVGPVPKNTAISEFMMKTSNTPRRLALVAGLVSAGMLSQGFAAITKAAGTTVSNTALITGYTVGGVQQLTGGSTIQSNNGVPTDFVVDRKIDLVVAQTNSALAVLAGSS